MNFYELITIYIFISTIRFIKNRSQCEQQYHRKHHRVWWQRMKIQYSNFIRKKTKTNWMEMNRVIAPRICNFGIRWWALHFFFSLLLSHTFLLAHWAYIFLFEAPKSSPRPDRQKTYDVRQIWICGCVAVCVRGAFVCYAIRLYMMCVKTVDFQLVSKSELYYINVRDSDCFFFT